MSMFSIMFSASAGQTAATFVAGSALGAALCRATGWGRVVRLGKHLSSARDRHANLVPPSIANPTVRRDGVSGNTARRARTGRLSLPQGVAEMSAGEVPALERVNDFVDRLAALPLADWLSVGRLLAADRVALTARSSAWPILDAAIGVRGLRVAAWYVRDAVETAAFLASGSACGWTSDERRAFAGAHRAAEEAALALLVQPDLPAIDFAVFYAPFMYVAPVDSMERVIAHY